MELTTLAVAIVAAGSAIITFVVSLRLGVNPAQHALVATLTDTVTAQRERIACLEAEVIQLRRERDIDRVERVRLERRIVRLERLIIDKFLALSSEQIDRLLSAMEDEETAA